MPLPPDKIMNQVKELEGNTFPEVQLLAIRQILVRDFTRKDELADRLRRVIDLINTAIQTKRLPDLVAASIRGSVVDLYNRLR